MSARFVEVVATALEKMSLEDLAALVGKVAPGLEVKFIESTPYDPDLYAVVPRRMSEAMMRATYRDHWTEANAGRVLQELWRKAIDIAEREARQR